MFESLSLERIVEVFFIFLGMDRVQNLETGSWVNSREAVNDVPTLEHMGVEVFGIIGVPSAGLTKLPKLDEKF